MKESEGHFGTQKVSPFTKENRYLKIPDSHTVEEKVNYISHWKCSCLGIFFFFDDTPGYGHDPVSIWPVTCD